MAMPPLTSSHSCSMISPNTQVSFQSYSHYWQSAWTIWNSSCDLIWQTTHTKHITLIYRIIIQKTMTYFWRCGQKVPRLLLLRTNGVCHGHVCAAGVRSHSCEAVCHVMSHCPHWGLCYTCLCDDMNVCICDYTQRANIKLCVKLSNGDPWNASASLRQRSSELGEGFWVVFTLLEGRSQGDLTILGSITWTVLKGVLVKHFKGLHHRWFPEVWHRIWCLLSAHVWGLQ